MHTSRRAEILTKVAKRPVPAPAPAISPATYPGPGGRLRPAMPNAGEVGKQADTFLRHFSRTGGGGMERLNFLQRAGQERPKPPARPAPAVPTPTMVAQVKTAQRALAVTLAGGKAGAGVKRMIQHGGPPQDPKDRADLILAALKRGRRTVPHNKGSMQTKVATPQFATVGAAVDPRVVAAKRRMNYTPDKVGPFRHERGPLWSAADPAVTAGRAQAQRRGMNFTPNNMGFQQPPITRPEVSSFWRGVAGRAASAMGRMTGK